MQPLYGGKECPYLEIFNKCTPFFLSQPHLDNDENRLEIEDIYQLNCVPDTRLLRLCNQSSCIWCEMRISVMCCCLPGHHPLSCVFHKCCYIHTPFTLQNIVTLECVYIYIQESEIWPMYCRSFSQPSIHLWLLFLHYGHLCIVLTHPIRCCYLPQVHTQICIIERFLQISLHLLHAKCMGCQ